MRDNFEVGSFANNDGTHRWYGDWVEQNDNNTPHDGKVTIGWLDRGGNRLILGGNGAIYRRAATPSSSATVTLKFKYSRASLEAGEYVSVQASGNGGTQLDRSRSHFRRRPTTRASSTRATTSPPTAAAIPRSASSAR